MTNERSGSSWIGGVSTSVASNIISAGVLFLAALAFKPQIYALLRPPEIPQYPLICYAELRSVEDQGRMWVEFFIINLRDERLSREELQNTLESFGPADLRVTPDIELKMDVNVELLDYDKNTDFNDGKG